MLDLAITGGTVVDGTGAPARRADVGVKNGRVVTVGELEDGASSTIDADGLLVSPGFVDLHTHYDAQLFWDPTASPSPLHGVTTVIGGNCGFSLAPAGPAHADYLRRLMARVEGMPLASLETGLDWEWTSFASWLDRLEGRIGVNAGFLVGHSALRRAAMGEAAVGSPGSEDDIKAMVAGLHEALAAGAMGFSTSQASTHHDGAGDPVPSRFATSQEIEALARGVKDHPGTTLELIIQGCLNGFTDDEVEFMTRLSLLADRPLNWNVLGVSASNPEGVEHQLAASTTAAKNGATVVALTLPHAMQARLSFLSGAILQGLPGEWSKVMALPVPERLAALADQDLRRRLAEAAQSEEAGVLRGLMAWDLFVLEETFAPSTKKFEGRQVGDLAAEAGRDPFDVVLDVIIADELRTVLVRPLPERESDWEARARIWLDPRTIVGGSDAGAHLDMMCGAVYSTALLGDAVRQRSLLSWEDAIRQLSDVPARLYGLTGRGRLVEGFAADIVVIDPERVGHLPVRTRQDLPGSASRLYAEATGIEHVLVNGIEVARDGSFTGEVPGTVLRSGRDTETVPAAYATSVLG